MTTSAIGRRVRVGDIELYAEVTGDGPAVLLVPGAGGDAGQYDALRDHLPGRTVITYDRRSNSRSSRRDDWTSTSIEQQADDAAALLTALDAGPATVFGNSMGAGIALALALRHPGACSAAVLHEPAIMAVLADPEAALAVVQPVLGAGMATGGFAGGVDAFFTFADDAGYTALPENVRGRLRDNGQVLFESEFGAFASWRPDEDLLRSSAVPLTVAVAEQTAPLFEEAATWLAAGTNSRVRRVGGGHLGFVTHADDVATLIG